MKSLIRRGSGALSLEYILLTFDPNTYIQTIFFNMTLPTVEGIVQ